MFTDGFFDFGVTRQRSALTHAEPLSRLYLRNTVIFYALLDNDAGGLLREKPSCAVATVRLLSGHCLPAPAVPKTESRPSPNPLQY